MQLTRFSDLSLRALMYLADREGESLATISEIALKFNVPENHLVKVVHQLGKAGYIETLRGKGGGLRLKSEPKDLRIGDIVRFTEGHPDLIDCYTQPCPLRGMCPLKGALDQAQEAFYAKLNEYTLADVAKSVQIIHLKAQSKIE